VLVEFIETYEAHHNLASQDPSVEIDQFVDYFSNISALYDSDATFANVMKHTLGSSTTQSQQAAQPQAQKIAQPEPEMRAKPQNVYRSGMGSQANPLNNTKDYYPPVNNATRGASSGTMFATS
jgi:hypothetical protein